MARQYEGEAECVRYAAMDIAGTYARGKEAAALCDSTPTELRAGACYEAVGYMTRYLRRTKAERRAECRSIARTPVCRRLYRGFHTAAHADRVNTLGSGRLSTSLGFGRPAGAFGTNDRRGAPSTEPLGLHANRGCLRRHGSGGMTAEAAEADRASSG